jgi:hypothetical protein
MSDQLDAAPNWVQARYDCSPKRMLDTLWRQVEKDTNHWNRLHDTVRFIPDVKVDVGVYRFAVLRQDKRDAKVFFIWNGESIDVTGPGGMALRVRFAVNDAGDCVYRIDDTDLQAWQVARRALEAFLFAD